jgi:ATP-dependent protease HslVU (ClpYQ) peptidase subunit
VTLIVGLRGADGVVLASDSQATHGALKQEQQKLFRSGKDLIWGTAGELAASQMLYTELERFRPDRDLDRETGKAWVKKATMATVEERTNSGPGNDEWFEGLFAWYSSGDRRTFLLHARHDGWIQFMPRYGAIGSSRQLGEVGFFGFSRSEFLDYGTLPLEITKMLTFMVAEDAVKASAKGVDLPIQVAVSTADATSVLHDEDLTAVKDTATAFRMHQMDFLKRPEGPSASRSAPGLIPGKRG